MSNITTPILVPMDLSAGASAVNYTPKSTICPILAFHCIASGGTGTVKLTPYRATTAVVGGSGSGGRLRIACNANGAIVTAEIAAGGTGYANGPVAITLDDPYGIDGIITCSATGGALNSVSIVSAGSDYSGYILLNTVDLIEGVTYDIIPRYIEQFGTGPLTLLGYRQSSRPFQSF